MERGSFWFLIHKWRFLLFDSLIPLTWTIMSMWKHHYQVLCTFISFKVFLISEIMNGGASGVSQLINYSGVDTFLKKFILSFAILFFFSISALFCIWVLLLCYLVIFFIIRTFRFLLALCMLSFLTVLISSLYSTFPLSVWPTSFLYFVPQFFDVFVILCYLL